MKISYNFLIMFVFLLFTSMMFANVKKPINIKSYCGETGVGEGSGTYIFEWILKEHQNNTNPTDYILEISSRWFFKKHIVIADTFKYIGNETNRIEDISNLDVNTKYWWRIIAIDSITNKTRKSWKTRFFTGGVLPVELTSFSVIIFDNTINLKWETATEVNNYGFEIERSIKENEQYNIIGFVEGHGNSNSPKQYNFIDNEINQSGTYYYRLKQVDNDGTFEYSKTVEINFDNPNNFKLMQNYPNPFNTSTIIKYEINTDSDVSLRVYDLIGNEISILINEYQSSGIYYVNFDASCLASGSYFYRLNVGNKTFIKTMTLIK